MKPDIEALRKKYMDNPPEGMTSQDHYERGCTSGYGLFLK